MEELIFSVFFCFYSLPLKLVIFPHLDKILLLSTLLAPLLRNLFSTFSTEQFLCCDSYFREGCSAVSAIHLHQNQKWYRVDAHLASCILEPANLFRILKKSLSDLISNVLLNSDSALPKKRKTSFCLMKLCMHDKWISLYSNAWYSLTDEVEKKGTELYYSGNSILPQSSKLRCKELFNKIF